MALNDPPYAFAPLEIEKATDAALQFVHGVLPMLTTRCVAVVEAQVVELFELELKLHA